VEGGFDDVGVVGHLVESSTAWYVDDAELSWMENGTCVCSDMPCGQSKALVCLLQQSRSPHVQMARSSDQAVASCRPMAVRLYPPFNM
jgi:hypothetical protein